MSQPQPILHTLKEAAQLLRISRTKLYELLDSRELESVHIGRSRKVPADALRAYVEGLRTRNREESR